MKVATNYEKHITLLKSIINDTFKIDRGFLADVLLCGGAPLSIITGTHINDLDFYCRDPARLSAVYAAISNNGFKVIHESTNAVTFKRAEGRIQCVQLIKAFYGEPDVIFDSFDFSVVQICFDFAAQHFIVANEQVFKDVEQKVLRFVASKYPVCALIRTRKYVKKGYSINGRELRQIFKAIAALKCDDYATLKEQLGGIDTLYVEAAFEQLMQTHIEDGPLNYDMILDAIIKAMGTSMIGNLTDEDDCEDDCEDAQSGVALDEVM